MSNLTKLEFAALDVNGKNYMSWTIDVKMHLESMAILDTLKEVNLCSSQDRAKANIFLRRHVDDMLKFEYLNTNDPSILWKDLREMFDHQKEVLLPAARDEWNSLRFQDFKKVNDYSSALFRICSQLKFCGQSVTDADMLEKTYSTFHASNITLQQQYRLQKFKRYSELNSFLLVVEQNNELLMKNHQSRPTGSLAFPEANAIEKNGPRNNVRGRGRGRGRGCGHIGQNHFYGRGHIGQNHFYGRHQNFGRGQPLGRGRSYNRGRGRNYNHVPHGNRTQPHNKLKMTKPDAGPSHSENPGDSCYRCGSSDHWSRTCRIPQHLCQLYKESLKGKEKEVNLVDNLQLDNLGVPNTNLNVSDFFNDVVL
ncbi:hypothetical protein OSB04_016339 [Centaurea solstitialis]|uniref:CCHC-type domain-containing protein n=1 Tax=Centaurea solstitialis TaxID=347529 RepID=A0AA38T2D8_9ASTR|nr:hypothetical protein OSB04_016339 [Centaurea solstitialis]